MAWRLVSWNVNGIRAAEKKGFLDWLAASNADVVAVQETKAHPDQLSDQLRHPPGYVCQWSAAEKKGYSGVGTYSRIKPRRELTGLSDARFDHEGRVLISEFEPFVLANIYFPNGGRGPEWVEHKLAFYKRFLEIAAQYRAAGRPVVVTGDFNTAYAEIDLARPKENAKTSGFMASERAGLGEFFAAGLTDTFRHLYPETVKYTWWDQVTRARERGVGWRLDYFMVSEDLRDKIAAAEIHDEVPGSDHCPISLVLNV
ncbi:MAG: exodeoxyribonuclease III [Anaerolineales bacterium]|nr:exodeoxyribonuclease III [Anaerolineales bacterium]